VKKPTYIDLFAGCGGLSLGLHQAGWRGLFAVEKSPLAFETLRHNLINKKAHFDWPEWLKEPRALDIDSVNKEYRDHLISLRGKVDLIAGGPPCQGFSTAGRRREDDDRNNLVRSYLRFIQYVQPRLIFFENVKGFTLKFEKNKKRGLAYSGYVTAMLEKLGYQVKGQLVDFSQFGIPQKRTRFILVGIKKGLVLDRDFTFFDHLLSSSGPFLKSRGLSKATKLKDAISDLVYSNGTVDCPDRNNFRAGLYSENRSEYQKYLRDGTKSNSPDSHSFPRHRSNTIERFEFYLKSAQKNKSINKEIKRKLNINKHTIIPLDANSPCPTLTTLPDDYIHYLEPRILTVREYARIQSFPDWYEFKGKYTTGGKERVKEVPRYTQIGNAIPPLFAVQAGIQLQKLLK